MTVYVVVDVGCIECGEPSDVIGVFTDRGVAEMVADDCIDLQQLRWRGEHQYIVQEAKVDELANVPYYVSGGERPRLF